MPDLSQPTAHVRRRWSLDGACAWGYGAGFAFAILLTLFGVVRSGFRVSGYWLVLSCVYWPALGFAVGCLLWRPAECMRDHLSEAPQEVHSRKGKRFVEAGVSVGVIYGFVATVLDVLTHGWSVLTLGLIFNLLLFPFLGLLAGIKRAALPVSRAGHGDPCD